MFSKANLNARAIRAKVPSPTAIAASRSGVALFQRSTCTILAWCPLFAFYLDELSCPPLSVGSLVNSGRLPRLSVNPLCWHQARKDGEVDLVLTRLDHGDDSELWLLWPLDPAPRQFYWLFRSREELRRAWFAQAAPSPSPYVYKSASALTSAAFQQRHEVTEL